MAQWTFTCRDYSTGWKIPNSPGGNFQPGSATLEAQPTIDGSPYKYGFLFWNAPGIAPTTNKKVQFYAPSGSEATAWYAGEFGDPGILVSAFSDGGNHVLAETPIKSVSPAAAWSGNGGSVSNATEAVITAKNSLSSDPGETFEEWLQFGDGTISGPTLTVPAGKTCLAFATYKQLNVKVPTIDPSGLLYVKILAGIIGGGDGIEQLPNGRIVKIHHDPEPWTKVAAWKQDLLLALAIDEIGGLMNNSRASHKVTALASELAKESVAKVDAAGK